MECGRACACSRPRSLWNCTRSRAVLRSSTGPFQRNGTSGKPTYKNDAGERVVDFQRSNLHVLNYSVPVHRTMSLAELRPHLFTLSETPDWIPYRTSYYRETWGFCLSQKQFERMEDGEYEVCIDSTLEPGHLTYGEYRIPGASDDEVLISGSRMPSFALQRQPLGDGDGRSFGACSYGVSSLHYSYRFLWIPGTIGSITWLARNEAVLPAN